MPVSDYMPAVSDVAALLRQRTVNDFSNEVGTFDATTRPTNTQVQITLNQAASLVSALIGADIAPSVFDAAKYLVTLRAAMFVELSYFNEQIRPDKSAYNELKELWDTDSKAIITAVTQAGVSDGGGDDDAPGAADDAEGAIFAFPEDCGGVLGWETQW